MNKKGSNNVKNADTKLSSQAKSMLDEFSENKEQNKILMHKITRTDEHGNLFVDLGTPEIRGIVPYLNVIGKPYNIKRSSRWVGTTNVMIVDSVDYDNSTVSFDMITAKKQAKESLRKYLINELQHGRKPVINNCLVKRINVYQNRILLNIGGVGIFGYAPVSEWGHGLEIEKFMPITVRVEKYRPARFSIESRKLAEEAFICSSQEILPNTIIEETHPVDNIFEVTCEETEPKFWVASTDNLPNKVLCMYPNPEKGIIIKIGKKYKVFITNFDEETKCLRARLLSEIK